MKGNISNPSPVPKVRLDTLNADLALDLAHLALTWRGKMVRRVMSVRDQKVVGSKGMWLGS